MLVKFIKDFLDFSVRKKVKYVSLRVMPQGQAVVPVKVQFLHIFFSENGIVCLKAMLITR